MMSEESKSQSTRALRVLVVDDEPFALADTMESVAEADASAQVWGAAGPMEALAWAVEHVCDVALLDIEMPGMSGIELVQGLVELLPAVRIVFVTSYDNYALEAFGVHAQGYLLKPVDVEALAFELDRVRAALPAQEHERPADAVEVPLDQEPLDAEDPGEPAVSDTPVAPLLRVVTFGGFEVHGEQGSLTFPRRRAKDLLALLIDRGGRSVATREGAAALWPDAPYDNSKRSYYQSIVRSLRNTLEKAGAGAVLRKSWNSLSVDPAALDCDLYRALAGDADAMAAYHHNYLPQYEWAEETSAILDRKLYGDVV